MASKTIHKTYPHKAKRKNEVRFGTVARWNDDIGPGESPEPIGRFLVIGPSDLAGFVSVQCVVAAPDTDWHVGDVVPVRRYSLVVADE